MKPFSETDGSHFVFAISQLPEHLQMKNQTFFNCPDCSDCENALDQDLSNRKKEQKI